MQEHATKFLGWLQEYKDLGSATKDALAVLRKTGWEQLIRLGLPFPSTEAFGHVPLRDLYASTFVRAETVKIDKKNMVAAILPESAHSHLVFINGVFCPASSDLTGLPPGIVLRTLPEALKSHGPFLHNHLSRVFKEEKDPFALLNFVLHPQGVFIYVPPKMAITSPIHCLHVLAGPSFQMISPRLQVVLGAHSRIKWMTDLLILDDSHGHFVNAVSDFSLEDGAQMDRCSHLHGSDACWIFDALRANVKQNARCDMLSVSSGSKSVRQSICVRLLGEGSEANVKGLTLLQERMRSLAHVKIEHTAPHARSMQLFKGVLDDASQSSFEGKIVVRQEAQKTEAYQLNNHLILGQAAMAYSKPNLEIYADDVKASHGATVARPDDSLLFYLKSRGIDLATAQQLLVRGFCQEILDQIPYPTLQSRCERLTEQLVKREV